MLETVFVPAILAPSDAFCFAFFTCASADNAVLVYALQHVRSVIILLKLEARRECLCEKATETELPTLSRMLIKPSDNMLLILWRSSTKSTWPADSHGRDPTGTGVQCWRLGLSERS